MWYHPSKLPLSGSGVVLTISSISISQKGLTSDTEAPPKEIQLPPPNSNDQ